VDVESVNLSIVRATVSAARRFRRTLSIAKAVETTTRVINLQRLAEDTKFLIRRGLGMEVTPEPLTRRWMFKTLGLKRRGLPPAVVRGLARNDLVRTTGTSNNLRVGVFVWMDCPVAMEPLTESAPS